MQQQKIVWSWKKEIPQAIKNIRDGVIYGVSLCLPMADFISPKLHMTLADFAGCCGVAIIIAKVAAKFCGIEDGSSVTMTKTSAPNDQELQNK